MPVSRLRFESLPHAIFLQRASGRDSAAGLEARLGQGAFLALRLVDLLAPDPAPVSEDSFHYQWIATDRFCRELSATAAEGAHIHAIAQSASEARRLDDAQLVAPSLFAYGHYLETELRLEEAIDVLATMLGVVGSRLSPADAVAARLRFARVHRMLNRFDEAEAAYAEAGELARRAGDRYSELVSRIGRAETERGRGNLADAERQLLEVLAEARATGERYAEALAEQGLGVALSSRGQPDLAVQHLCRAYALYDDEETKIRVLCDVGLMLLMLGDSVGAERALLEVLRRGPTDEVASNAMIELMHCASFRRDHVGFARWRERCEQRLPDMPPNIRTDFYFKQGIGQARFGRYQRAAELMKQALDIAGATGLHEFEFRIERILAGLNGCEQALKHEVQPATEPVIHNAELDGVAEFLALLSRGSG